MSRSLSERKLSKLLNSELQFNSTGLSVESGNADPTVTIVEAKKGSLYLCTNGNLYKKQSDLLDLDWIIMPESASGGGVDSVNGETGVVVLDKSDIGLSNVDNTSDANKPVSSAQAIANTADRARANHTGTQLAATISDFSSAASSAAPVQSVAGQTGIVVLAKADVGLSNVDNTADSSKPVSTAQGLADTAVQDFSIQRANHTGTQLAATISDLSKSSVGLGNVDNTSDLNKPVSTAQGLADTAVQDFSIQRANHTGTQLAATISDFNTAAASAAPVTSVASKTGVVTLDKTDVGLSNVDNTSDATKDAASTTLTNKTLTSPVINTPTGIVKCDVGLGNVDNTSDADKPVSTATQTALNLKANLASPTLTGVPLAPTAAPATNTTQIATTAFVTAAISGGGGANTTLSNLTSPVAINQNIGFGTDNTYDIGDIFKTAKDIWYKGVLRLQSGVTTIFDVQLSGLFSVIRHMGGIGTALNIESNGAMNFSATRATLWSQSHGFTLNNNNTGDIKLAQASGGGGGIILDPRASTGGVIKFVNNNVTPTVGHVWTATATDGSGVYLAPTITTGNTASRPVAPLTGRPYFDTTLSRPIWYDGTNWILADGTVV